VWRRPTVELGTPLSPYSPTPHTAPASYPWTDSPMRHKLHVEVNTTNTAESLDEESMDLLTSTSTCAALSSSTTRSSSSWDGKEARLTRAHLPCGLNGACCCCPSSFPGSICELTSAADKLMKHAE